MVLEWTQKQQGAVLFRCIYDSITSGGRGEELSGTWFPAKTGKSQEHLFKSDQNN